MRDSSGQFIGKAGLARNIILANGSKCVTVTFVKRTKNGKKLKAGETPEIRTMNCRLGVKKHLKGGTLKYDPKIYDLLTTFDMQKKAYRCISLDSIKEIVADGEVFDFDAIVD